ncbi:indole-3-glycerol-phosphate synthase [Aureococcus anophagefferens]|nr:indole-3-glycerol-phosphate synthase [Aureococcus anophagefferens]
MRRVAWAVLAAAGAAAPRAVDVARYERQAARFMADAGGGRRLGGGSPSDGPADAIDPNWELVKKSLEGLMIKEVWLTLSTIAYYSRLSLSYQLDRFCGSDGQASAYKALIAEGMLPAAAGARMSQCNEIGRGLIWAQIESIGTDYYYVCLVTGEYWEYTNTLGNRTVYGSANAEAEASDFHAACAAACAAANVTAFCSCYYETDDLGAPTGLLHGDGYPESWDCRESTLYPAAEETGAWSLPIFDENGTNVGVAGSDVSMDSFSVLLKSWRDVFAPHHVVFIVSGAGGASTRGASASAVVADAARWFAGRDYEDDRLYVVGGAFVRSIALYFDVYQGPLDWHMVFVQDVACADFTYADPGLGRCEPCEWPYLSRSGVDCDMCVAGYYYGAEVATLNLDRGRWRPHRGSLDVFRCDVREACAGGAIPDGGGAGDLCGSKYEGRLCSACGGYRWKTMAGKCRNCGAYEAIASIALYFVGTVAVVLLLLSLSVTELPGHTMLQRRGRPPAAPSTTASTTSPTTWRSAAGAARTGPTRPTRSSWSSSGPWARPALLYALCWTHRGRIDPFGFRKGVDLERAALHLLVSPREILDRADAIRENDPVIGPTRMIWIPYEPEFWYFESVETIRRMGYTVASAVIPEGGMLLVFLVLLTCASLKVYGGYRPFDETDNLLAENLSWLLLAIYLIALACVLRDDASNAAVDAILNSLVALAFCYGIAVVAADLTREKKIVAIVRARARRAPYVVERLRRAPRAAPAAEPPPRAARGCAAPSRTKRFYLEEVVRAKLAEVEGLNAKHASGQDSDVRSRLAFGATKGNTRFSAALRRTLDDGSRQLSVVADVKRRSPHGGRDGGGATLASFSDAGKVCGELANWPVDALSVCADGPAYGGALEDVSAARRAVAGLGAARPPILFKDFVVDPIQIALAAELGADAVLLSTTVLGGRLVDLLDIATVCGVECAVEVHTPNECQFALNAGATLLVCTNVDRTTGVNHDNQALGLKGLIRRTSSRSPRGDGRAVGARSRPRATTASSAAGSSRTRAARSASSRRSATSPSRPRMLAYGG